MDASVFINALPFPAVASLPASALTPASSTEDHRENHRSKLPEEDVELIEQLRKVGLKGFYAVLKNEILPLHRRPGVHLALSCGLFPIAPSQMPLGSLQAGQEGSGRAL